MTTAVTNVLNIQVGDLVFFTNRVNYPIYFIVERVTDKSWYARRNGRMSFGSLANFSKYADFKIIKSADANYSEWLQKEENHRAYEYNSQHS